MEALMRKEKAKQEETDEESKQDFVYPLLSFIFKDF